MKAWKMENGRIVRCDIPEYSSEKEEPGEYLTRLGYKVPEFSIGNTDYGLSLSVYTKTPGDLPEEGWLIELTVGNVEWIICKSLGDLIDGLRIIVPIVKAVSEEVR